MTSPAAVRAPWRSADSRALWLANAVAGTAIGLAAIIEIGRGSMPSFQPAPLVAILVTLAGVALSIRLPWPGLAVTSLATVVGGVLGWLPLVEWSCAVFLVFSIVIRRGRPWLAGLIAALPIAAGLAFEHDTSGGPIAVALGSVVSVAAAAAIGYGLRTQWQYRAVLVQRAKDAVATREIEADRRVAEERLRIARDLHDVVGHEIAVVSMRIGVAEVSLPPDAVEARTALAEARTSVQKVLTETQDILALLRRAGDQATTGPTPGPRGISDLLTSYRQLGLDIEGEVPGELGLLDAASGLALYRVMQEALTNAHRYGSGVVRLRFAVGETVHLEAANDRGPRRDATGGGLGLIGMRERVRAAGGPMAVSDEGEEFRLLVELPLGSGATA